MHLYNEKQFKWAKDLIGTLDDHFPQLSPKNIKVEYDITPKSRRENI